MHAHCPSKVGNDHHNAKDHHSGRHAVERVDKYLDLEKELKVAQQLECAEGVEKRSAAQEQDLKLPLLGARLEGVKLLKVFRAEPLVVLNDG